MGDAPLPVIFAHVPITRRKTLCHVDMGNNEIAYSTGHLADALAWVYDQGHTAAILDHAGALYKLEIARHVEAVEQPDPRQMSLLDA